MRKSFKFNVEKSNGEKHHFYASSLGEWKVMEDPASLIDYMKRQGLSFNLWYVPAPIDADYLIAMFAPQHEGSLWLGLYKVTK